jgi:hypothetical protein
VARLGFEARHQFNIVYREPFRSATAPSDVDGAIATHGLDTPDLIMVLGIPDGIAYRKFGHRLDLHRVRRASANSAYACMGVRQCMG